jgi:hypothetical protein
MPTIEKNKYDSSTFINKFSSSELFKKVLEMCPPSTTHYKWDNVGTLETPREDAFNSTIYLKSFYYLQFLLENKPTKIYDIGCGFNFFKMFIPEIIGITPPYNTAKIYANDIKDTYDNDFVLGHKDYFDCLFSINALHFRPITEFKQTLINTMSMLTDNGRCYIALNSERMINDTPSGKLMELFNTLDPTVDDRINYFVSELNTMDLTNFIVIDFVKNKDEYMSGNVHLVFDKSSS